jgi:hypothetical protein
LLLTGRCLAKERTNPLFGGEYKVEDCFKIYKVSVRTSQETHYVSTTKTNQLMLFRETVAVYCENHKEHTNTLCGHNAEFLYVKLGGALGSEGLPNSKIFMADRMWTWCVCLHELKPIAQSFQVLKPAAIRSVTVYLFVVYLTMLSAA